MRSEAAFHVARPATGETRSQRLLIISHLHDRVSGCFGRASARDDVLPAKRGTSQIWNSVSEYIDGVMNDIGGKLHAACLQPEQTWVAQWQRPTLTSALL